MRHESQEKKRRGVKRNSETRRRAGRARGSGLNGRTGRDKGERARQRGGAAMKGPPGAGGVDRSIQNIAGGAFFHLSLPAWHLPPTPPSHTWHTRRSGPINWEICVYVCVRDGWLLPHRAVCCLRSVHVDKCDNTRLLVFGCR